MEKKTPKKKKKKTRPPKPIRTTGPIPKAITKINKAEDPELEAALFRLHAVVDPKIDAAMMDGAAMIVVYALNGTEVNMYRKSHNFPVEDFDTAIDLLENDLRNERERIIPPDDTDPDA